MTAAEHTATGQPPTRQIGGYFRRLGYAESARRFSIWIALVLFVLYCVVRVPHFATAGNVGDILAAVPALGVAALGQTFVIVVGGIDLSVGQMASLVGVVAAGVATANAQLIYVIPLAMAFGLVAGLFTGAAITVARANPVIVTFGMLSIYQGLTFLYSQISVGRTPGALSSVENVRVLGVFPVSVLILVALIALAWFVFSRTPFGTYVQAVGGNEGSALRSGVPVSRVKLACYAISGLSGAAAGLFLFARLGTGYPGAGNGLELSAIVAVILGGTPFGGGRGTILGTMAGVLLLTTLANALNLLAIGAEVQLIINGLVVAVGVSLYATQRFRRWQ